MAQYSGATLSTLTLAMTLPADVVTPSAAEYDAGEALLLIEDDEAYQLAMASHLRELSTVERVSVASDGEEGLADMRALLAIDEAARTGETVCLEPRQFKAGVQPQMRRAFAPTTRRLVL